jgi:glycerol-3-phosphate acyltransferase PlsY
MDLLVGLLAAVVGYVCGAISFARIVTMIVAPQQDVSAIRLELPDGSAEFESHAVSATTVRLHVGDRYGCLTGILDMFKAGIPALIFRRWQPETPHYLIAAGMAVVGHNWPIFYRFKGGRGLSPTLGGMLVVDWVGVLATNAAGMLIGLPIKNPVVTTGSGIVLMIPWIWFRNRNWAELTYVTSTNVLFWASMIPELKEYVRLKQEGKLEELLESEQIRVIGRFNGETVSQLTLSQVNSKLAALFKRVAS